MIDITVHTTNDRAIRIPLSNGGNRMCSERVNTNHIDKVRIPIKQIRVNLISVHLHVEIVKDITSF